MIIFNKGKASKVYRKDTNEERNMENTDENINDDTYQTVKSNKGRTIKVYAINTERKNIETKKRKSITECKR